MKKIILLLFCLVSNMATANEEYSLRRCMLLPIPDTVGNVLGFKVYESVEKYLKDKKWCKYKSSSEVIGIFSKYRDRLEEFLDDPKVIKTVSSRLQVGTIIRISIKRDAQTIELKLDIVGEEGVNKYFSEKTIINKIDIYQISTTIKNWLDLYETTIPYDGKISGVLGEQITFNFAKSKRIAIGQEFTIKRYKAKKRHPLLKKVVEWQSENIARGKVFNLSRGQGLGVIKVYIKDKPVSTGDWIKLEKYDPKKVINDKSLSKYEEQKFGRLGDLALSFGMASHTTSTSAFSGDNKMSGYTFGVSVEAEAWVTRNYFVIGEYSKRIGSLSKISGSPVSNTSAQTTTTLKMGGGFKYLPMGFFYGPQVNFYGAWVKHYYQLDSSGVDGFGTNTFGGIMLGIGGNIPLKKGLRLYGSGEIIPFGEFTEEDSFYTGSNSISSMVIEAGVHYQWTPTIRLLAGFEETNNSGRFGSPNTQLRYSDSTLKLGGVFSF